MRYLLIITLLIYCSAAKALGRPDVWTLRSSIDYALENNIQIRRAKLNLQLQEESNRQARASVFPTLSFSASESFANRRVTTPEDTHRQQQSFVGNYSLSSGVTLFNGFRLRNNIRQQDLFLQLSELAIREAEKNMEIAITSAYLQILFARESVKTAEMLLGYSEAQLRQGELFFRVGSIAESDIAQLRSRHINDRHRLVVAQNSLASQILLFKQLLELNFDDEIEIYFPELSADDIVNILPSLRDVYEVAASFMPQIESSRLEIAAAEYSLKMARGNMFPTLTMSAGISTGRGSIDSEHYMSQLYNNFSQHIGLSLGFSIFNRREVRTNIARSEIMLEDSKLRAVQMRKDLLRAVESVYLDVLSSQSRFFAAREALNAAQTSYELVARRFNLGMINTVELLNQRNAFENAQQEFLQAKFAMILSQKLLDFYQNIEISL